MEHQLSQPLSISLLGEFSLKRGEQTISNLNAERPQSLLAYLLLHRQSPISRQRLAYTFWPDSSDEQARTNLRNLLHTLRRNLPDADHFVLFDTHTVQWRVDAVCTLDVAEFENALAVARGAESVYGRQHALETAVSLYKGPLLPGNYDDWLIPIREQLQEAFLDALHQCARLSADLGDGQSAIHYARLWQKEDPLAETAVILLMQCYAQMGDQAAVRRTYQACLAALRQELDAEPGLETQSAYAAALQLVTVTDGRESEEEQLERVSVRRRSSPRQAPQLPPQPTPFVGREEELARLAEYLADPHCRLLTIVGPGGTGKTRLALQTAYGHVPVFADGVAFVPLTAVADAAILPSAIAQGLGFTFNAKSSRQTQLLQHLADKSVLLVLDNMEQLEERVELLAEILTTAPQVKLLATSRHRLHLQEEWVFPLHGLPVPDMHNLQHISQNSAATLFIQSARRHNASFVPHEADWQAIGRICHLVDGMPLGLELAAPWIRLLSCAEIGDEIEKNLDFLATTQHNIPERHRSLRAVFNQSWQMLTPTEEAVFSCLSLFVGGFSRESSEQVAHASLPILSSLLDKSLVHRLRNGRYDIHELLRQYAASMLAANRELAAPAHARFAAYFVSLTETAVAHLIGPEQQTWLNTLELEYDNLRAVLSWAVETGARETAVRLGIALGRYWWLRYRPVEGGAWLRQILAMPGPETEEYAQALILAGMLARLRRDYAEAETWLTQSLSSLRQTGSPQNLGRALNELGMLYLDQGHFSQALPLFTEWLTLARAMEFSHGISIALLNLGMVTQHLGDLRTAENYYQESLALSRQHNLKTNVAMVLNSYSTLLLEQKRLEAASAMLLESVQLNRALGHQDGLAWAFWGIFLLYYLEDNYEMTACLAGIQEKLRHELGAPLPPTNQLHFEKVIHDLQQQLGAESFAIYRERGQAMSLTEALSLVESSP